MIIDCTCTAMPRPKIHEECFRTYTQNITGVDWGNSTLYINIDPFPNDSFAEKELIKEKSLESIEIGKKYFGSVVYNLPHIPNYTAAYNWVWKNAQSELILNLEDDWALNRKIDIHDFINHFEECKTLYEVVLRAYSYKYPCTCTSPAILHKRYYGKIAGHLDTLRNPECQTHSRRDFGIFIPNHSNCPGDLIKKYVRVYPEENNNQNEVISNDIGRVWLENSPYMRPQMLTKDDPRYLKKDKFRSWIIRREWDKERRIEFIRNC